MDSLEILLFNELLNEDEVLLEALALEARLMQIRTRNKTNNSGLQGAENSALSYLLRNGDNNSYVAILSLPRETFEQLLCIFGPYYLETRSWRIGHAGRPPTFVQDEARFGLGVVLAFYRGTYELSNLSTFCGIPPSTCSSILHRAELALQKALAVIPEAQIRWPSYAQQVEWSLLVNNKQNLVHNRWGFIDGKNYDVQKPRSDDLQNSLFNGWLHRNLITGTLCFGADGTIVWAKLQQIQLSQLQDFWKSELLHH
jgi:hypothetical protein